MLLPWGTLYVLQNSKRLGEGGAASSYPFPFLCSSFPQLPSFTHSRANEPLLHHEMTICAPLNLGKGKFGKVGAAQLGSSLELKLGTRDLRRKLSFP